MAALKWIYHHFEEAVMTAALACMALVMMLQIIARYCFGSPFPWPEELARYLLITSCFLGSAYVLQRDFLIRMDVIIKFLPTPFNLIVDGLGRVTTIVFFFAFFGVSITMVRDCYQNGLTAAALPIPFWIVYAIISFGLCLSALRSIGSFVKWVQSISSKTVSGGDEV